MGSGSEFRSSHLFEPSSERNSEPDTISDVIHDRAERAPAKAKRSEVVNNSAAPQNCGGAKTAAGRTPSSKPFPARNRVRLRTARSARRTTSERTTPQEGSCISSTLPRRVKSAQRQQPHSRFKMKSWEEHLHFAGLDWASDHHDLSIINAQGQLEASLRFSHDSDGWSQARELLSRFGRNIPVAVETRHGIAIEQLHGCGCIVYPVHPLSAKQYRQRKAPSGVKDDQLDAWSLADALRVDGHARKALSPEDPLIITTKHSTSETKSSTAPGSSN
jgi:hypothetical protein